MEEQMFINLFFASEVTGKIVL